MITNNILELRKIKECRDALKEREIELVEPTLGDTSLLQAIHTIIKQEYSKNKRLHRYDEKEYFIAIIIFLYSPKSYMGDKVRVGIRDGIAKVLDTSPARVSNIFRIVREWIIIYTEFRRGVEYLYSKVLDKLQYGV